MCVGQFPRIRPENKKGTAKQAAPTGELGWDSGLAGSNNPELSAEQRISPWVNKIIIPISQLGTLRPKEIK